MWQEEPGARDDAESNTIRFPSLCTNGGHILIWIEHVKGKERYKPKAVNDSVNNTPRCDPRFENFFTQVDISFIGVQRLVVLVEASEQYRYLMITRMCISLPGRLDSYWAAIVAIRALVCYPHRWDQGGLESV